MKKKIKNRKNLLKKSQRKTNYNSRIDHRYKSGMEKSQKSLLSSANTPIRESSPRLSSS